MREKFTDEEWALVRHVPVDAFMMVALCDGDLDDKETESFAQELAQASMLKNPMHRAAAEDLASGQLASELEFQAKESAPEMKQRMDRTKAMLKEKLSTPEYQSFFASVWITGHKVARAAGGGGGLFGRKKSNISDQETQALLAFAAAYEITPQALEEYSG